MAEDTFYISAGLQPSKEAGVSPSGDTFYIAAGLPPLVEAAAAFTADQFASMQPHNTIPKPPQLAAVSY